MTGLRRRAAAACVGLGGPGGRGGHAEGGLIPQEAIPALLAERDRIATQMAGRVADAGRRVVERIRGYEVVINEALRLLADQGFVAAGRAGRTPPPPPAPPAARASIRPAWAPR